MPSWTIPTTLTVHGTFEPRRVWWCAPSYTNKNRGPNKITIKNWIQNRSLELVVVAHEWFRKPNYHPWSPTANATSLLTNPGSQMSSRAWSVIQQPLLGAVGGRQWGSVQLLDSWTLGRPRIGASWTPHDMVWVGPVVALRIWLWTSREEHTDLMPQEPEHTECIKLDNLKAAWLRTTAS